MLKNPLKHRNDSSTHKRGKTANRANRTVKNPTSATYWLVAHFQTKYSLRRSVIIFEGLCLSYFFNNLLRIGKRQ